MTLTCLSGTPWELWFNGLVPLFSLEDLALARISPEHRSPLSQGKAGVSHGRWVLAAGDEVEIKKWARRENGNLSPTWIQLKGI